jgi:tetratricopeptide (TPR) repeat protein
MRQANELYRRGLSLGAFFVDGVLSRFTFRNIVTNGLILEEYAWVGQFIEQYQSYLSDTSRASMVSFNQARLEYRQKNYGKALDLLQKSDYRDVLLNLSAKTLLVKVFYEMGEYDLLESHLQAMRVFIRRKEELAYQQENFQKLVYFAQKMIELNPFDRQAKEQLREEITKTQVVAEKAWLLEMLGEAQTKRARPEDEP